MLETLREFGLEQLAHVGEDTATQQRHVAYYLAFAEEGYPNHFGPFTDIDRRLQLLEAEQPNLRAALVYVGQDSADRCVADLSGVISRPVLPAGLAADRMVRDEASCARDATSNAITVSTVTVYRFDFLASLFGATRQDISRTARQSL